MQPVSEANSPIVGQQPKAQEPVQNRGRGFGSVLGKVGNAFGIEVKPVGQVQAAPVQPLAPTPEPVTTQSVSEPVKNAFEGVPADTTPTAPSPLEPATTPTNPLEASSEIKDPGIPIDSVKVVEDPGISVQPQMDAVTSQHEIHEEPLDVAEVHTEPMKEKEGTVVPISFLEKWLLKHKLPDYVMNDGNIDDAKLTEDAKSPEALRSAGMSDEIVTLVGAVEARGVEIDEIVEAGIEEVYKRDQKDKPAA